MTLPAVLSAEEVAAILRVSVGTVMSMGRDGRLPRLPGLRVAR